MLSAYVPVQLHTPTTATATRSRAFSIDNDGDSTHSPLSDSEQTAHSPAPVVSSTSMPPQRAGEADEQVAMLRAVSKYNGECDMVVDAGSINGDTTAAGHKLHDDSDASGNNDSTWGTQVCISALSAISGFLFGYDLCVMVIALPLIQAVRLCVYSYIVMYTA